MKRRLSVLFVLDWLVVGGEETEVRLLAGALDRTRYDLSVAACFHQEGMTRLTERVYRRLELPLDLTGYHLDDDGRAAHLAALMRRREVDVVVACQGVRHVYRALRRMPARARPALIEHGGLVAEVARTPKDLTAAYVGVCRDIVAAAAAALPDPTRARLIPSMVDLREFEGREEARAAVRRELGWGGGEWVAGWVGRLDRKKRVEDFLEAAARLHRRRPETRFLLVGGPDAFMPDYAAHLAALTREQGLTEVTVFTGDRDDVPRYLAAMDAYAWLSHGEGMPHTVLEAGAAGLPVVCTADGGTTDVVQDGVSGLLVSHRDPPAVAAALERLLDAPDLAARLGATLRKRVERGYATQVVCAAWESLLDEVAAEHAAAAAATAGADAVSLSAAAG